MIKQQNIFLALCDNCGKHLHEGNKYEVIYTDRQSLKMVLKDSGWHLGEARLTYCPSCWYVDENDNIIIP